MAIIFNHTAHVKLWGAIIDTLKDGWLKKQKTRVGARHIKEEVFKDTFPDLKDYIEAYCFACGYDSEIIDMFTEENQPDDCKNCPLKWSSENCYSCGPYDKFDNAIMNNLKEDAIYWAEVIRDAPIKEGVETI